MEIYAYCVAIGAAVWKCTVEISGISVYHARINAFRY